MGQFIAEHVADWLPVTRLVLVDCTKSIHVGGRSTELHEYAKAIQQKFPSDRDCEVVAEVVDITDEDATRSLFERHPRIHYLLHTAGISPKPLTPPEQMSKSDVLGACEVNLWGGFNVIKQGIVSGSLIRGSRGVILLSTSATVGSEGRASAAYEVSKAGLANLLSLHSRYFVEKFGVTLNALAPSPLRGPMAAQNPISQRRLKAVELATPLGGLTEAKHIAAATMYFWSNECWCVGEVLTIDGGYTKHRPVFGDLVP